MSKAKQRTFHLMFTALHRLLHRSFIYCVIIHILCDNGYCFFPGEVRMVKRISVNEDLVSAMTFLGGRRFTFCCGEKDPGKAGMLIV